VSAVPPATLNPGDNAGTVTYDEVYARWVEQGRPHQVEYMRAGWLYKAMWPNTDQTQPIFGLMASARETLPNDYITGAGIGGYAAAMGTTQSSMPGGRRTLPQEAI
jgi:hypothetical protein